MTKGMHCLPRNIAGVPAVWRKQAEIVPGKINSVLAQRVASDLRYAARLAHLDGRSVQAKKFHRYADLLVAAAR